MKRALAGSLGASQPLVTDLVHNDAYSADNRQLVFAAHAGSAPGRNGKPAAATDALPENAIGHAEMRDLIGLTRQQQLSQWD